MSFDKVVLPRTHILIKIQNIHITMEKFLMTLTNQSLHLYQETSVWIYFTEDEVCL